MKENATLEIAPPRKTSVQVLRLAIQGLLPNSFSEMLAILANLASSFSPVAAASSLRPILTALLLLPM